MTSLQKYEEFCERFSISDAIIGRGNYSEVRLGRVKKTGEKVAIKILLQGNINKKEWKRVEREVEILKTLKHKHIVKFYGAYLQKKKSNNKIFIVMEKCSEGNLFDKIVDKTEEGFTEDSVRSIMKQLTSALMFCKDHNVVHRDIKPENILINSNNQLKLADFNLASLSSKVEDLETRCGTPNYMAPEVIPRVGYKGKYDYKCDVWSLGVILYLMLSGGFYPFNPESEGQSVLPVVAEGKWRFGPEEAWEYVSEEAKDLVSNMLKKNPKERFSYEEILNHDWMKNHKKPQGHITHSINTSSLTALRETSKRMQGEKSSTKGGLSYQNLYDDDDI